MCSIKGSLYRTVNETKTLKKGGGRLKRSPQLREESSLVAVSVALCAMELIWLMWMRSPSSSLSSLVLPSHLRRVILSVGTCFLCVRLNSFSPFLDFPLLSLIFLNIESGQDFHLILFVINAPGDFRNKRLLISGTAPDTPLGQLSLYKLVCHIRCIARGQSMEEIWKHGGKNCSWSLKSHKRILLL